MTTTHPLTADHLRIRNTVRAHFGDKWRDKVDRHRSLFAAVMAYHRCSEMEAVQHLAYADPPKDDGAALLIAVAVEMMEERL